MSTSIKATFATIVNGLIDFASKIPGVNKLLGLDKHRMEVPESLGKGHIPTPEEQLERLGQLKARSDFKKNNPDIAPNFVLDDAAWKNTEQFTMPYQEKFPDNRPEESVWARQSRERKERSDARRDSREGREPRIPKGINRGLTMGMEMDTEIPISTFTPATPQSIQTSQKTVAQTEQSVDSLIADKENREKENELLRKILVTLESDRKKAIQIQNRTSVEMDGKALGEAVTAAAGRQ
jgi:hypothetical protein